MYEIYKSRNLIWVFEIQVIYEKIAIYKSRNLIWVFELIVDNERNASTKVEI